MVVQWPTNLELVVIFWGCVGVNFTQNGLLRLARFSDFAPDGATTVLFWFLPFTEVSPRSCVVLFTSPATLTADELHIETS